jgi:iron only hydrogenase large subunit-like protein
MACPGGCVGGGGSPIRGDNVMRKDSIYQSDAKNPVRRSHENQEVLKLYKDYLGEPCGEKSHHLLHTHYRDRSGEVRFT